MPFEIFKTLVEITEVGTSVSIRLRGANPLARALEGVLIASTSEYIAVEAAGETHYIGAEEVLGFTRSKNPSLTPPAERPIEASTPSVALHQAPRDPDPKLAGLREDSPTRQEPHEEAVLEENEPSVVTARVEAPGPHSVTTRKKLSIAARAPSFELASIGLAADEREAFVHALNVYKYACKVREPQRLIAEAYQVWSAGLLAENTQLMTLAGELALFGGDSQRAKQIFEQLLEDGPPRVHYALAFTHSELGEQGLAAMSLATYLYRTSPAEDPEWRGLFAELLECTPWLTRQQMQTLENLSRASSDEPSKAELDAKLASLRSGRPDLSAEFTPLNISTPPTPPVRHLGTVTRIWPAEDYGFVTRGTPAGPRPLLFRISEISDDSLRRAISLGWTGTVTFIEVDTPAARGERRRVASDLKPEAPMSASRPKSSPSLGETERSTPPNHAKALVPTVARTYRSGSPGQANPPEKPREQPSGAPKQIQGRTHYLREAKRKELSGDLDGAARIYEAIIERNSPEAASAVKDLAWLRNRQGLWETALSILDNNERHLSSEPRAADNLRLNILLKGKQYEAARRVIVRLRRGASDRQLLALLKQDVYCCVGLNDVSTAENILNAGVERFPQDSSLVTLRDRVALSRDEAEKLDLTSLQNIGAGINDFSLYYLETADLVGADERSIARGYFDSDDFAWTLKSFDGIQGQRPRDRAKVMLTLAHMCWRDPLVAGEHDLSELLRRFYGLMAESQLVASAHLDSVRTFAIESLALASPERAYLELPVLLESYVGQCEGKQQERLRMAADRFARDDQRWSEFLDHYPYYESRCPHLRPTLERYVLSSDRRLSLPSSEALEDAVRERQLQLRTLSERLRALDHLGTVALEDLESSLASRARDAYFSLDSRRLLQLCDIVARCRRFLGESDFAERQVAYERARGAVSEFCDEVAERATMISLVNLKPFAVRLGQLLQAEQERFIANAQVGLSIDDALANDRYRLEADGSIKATLVVNVAPGSPPVEDVTITVEVDSGIELAEPSERVAVIPPGRSREIRIRVLPARVHIDAQAFSLKGLVSYSAAGAAGSLEFSLPVRLRTGGVFRLIDNPYESYSGGNIVDNPEMFFGRQDLLERLEGQVIRGPLGQCYVLYGQKRSGKSSVLEQLRQRLIDKCYPIKVTLGELDTNDADASFLSVCTAELIEVARDRGVYETVDWPDRPVNGPSMGYFKACVRALTRVSCGLRIVLLVDEFTYIYGYIRTGLVSPTFMKQWKALIESRLLSAVVVGQDSMPRFKAAYANEFGVTREERLSYLSQSQAVDLAEKPILVDGASRYRGGSMSRLLALTGGNPWYTQILCDKLVRHLNAEGADLITESDIELVARSLVSGESRLGVEFFNPLITAAGDTEDLYPAEAYLEVLRQVAWYSTAKHGVRQNDMESATAPESLPDVVEDLVARDVLRRNESGLLRITVGLFEEWLRVNRPLGVGARGIW